LYGGGVRPFVVLAARPQFHHCSLEQPRDAFDDIAIGHADPQEWLSRCGWWRREEGPFALEDADKPVEVDCVDHRLL
jgi:hypothetical protein